MCVRAWYVLATLALAGCGSGGGGGGGAEEERPELIGTQPDDGGETTPPDRRVVAFEEVAARVGWVGIQRRRNEDCNTFTGSGGGFGDIDLDGDQDFFATNQGGANFLYLNQGDIDGDGLPDHIDIAAALGLQEADKLSHAAVFVDYDNDGDQDLYVTHWAVGNTLWRNRLLEDSVLAFEDVTDAAGLRDEGRAITSAWADFDQDGFLDVYLAKHAVCLSDDHPRPGHRLYHARGDGTFEDWTALLCADGTRTCDDVNGLGFTAGWYDHDDDGDLDLYVVNDFTHTDTGNRHFRNDGPDGAGGWRFVEVSRELGTNFFVNGMGLGIGDLDNDGWFDLAFSDIEGSHVLHKLGDGPYEDLTNTCGVYESTQLYDGWGVAFLDADNDGWQDLFFVNGPVFGQAPQPDTFLLNNRDLTFTDLSREAGLDGGLKGRALAQTDLDRDGHVDFFVGNFGQQPYLYHNRAKELGSTQKWLVVTLEGTRSNRDAIGARLSLVAGVERQVRLISSGPSHGGGDERAAFFGLGTATFGHLRVRWPSGVEQDLGLVRANRHLHLVEPTE
jgi:hypothetical protein